MNRVPSLAVALSLLILGAVLGVWSEQKIFPPQEVQTKPAATQIPVQVVEGALVDRVFAQVRGEVVEKTAEEFVVRENEEELTLHVVLNGLTTFGKDGQDVAYETLEVGDYVTGGVSIENTTQEEGSETYEVVAHRISITPAVQQE